MCPATCRPLDRFPALRLVANFGVGYDRIDVAACAARGVAVTNTPGVLDAATADLAFALILAVRRRIVEGDDVTWADLNFALGRSNGHRHRTEMYRHVIALSDHAA